MKQSDPQRDQKKHRDPLQDPTIAFGELNESKFKAELDLVDRYQAFVAELLRISLAGIAVFGFLYQHIFSNLKITLCDPMVASKIICAKKLAAFSVIGFGLCTVCALIFRYFATEGARYYIEALRFTPDDIKSAKHSLDKRRRRIDVCRLSKAMSAIFLGLSGILIASAFYLFLTNM